MIYYKAIFDFPDGEYIVDRRNITALDVSQKDRGSADEISFGIYSNSGSISFIDDAERTILRYADEGKLSSGIKCDVYLVNSLAKSSNLVAEMYSTKWHYDDKNFSVSVDIQDELVEWQEIVVDRIPIMFDAVDEDGTEIPAIKPASYIASNYFIPKVKLNYPSADIVENSNSEVVVHPLENIYIANPYLDQCSLWAFGTKICELSASRIFKIRKKIFVRAYER